MAPRLVIDVAYFPVSRSGKRAEAVHFTLQSLVPSRSSSAFR